jgi:hypothetical protein
MTNEFKPGDQVRPVFQHTVTEVTDSGLLRFEDGHLWLSKNFELVEPSITHREIREVCERYIHWYSHPSIQSLIEQLMEALTGKAKQ